MSEQEKAGVPAAREYDAVDAAEGRFYITPTDAGSES